MEAKYESIIKEVIKDILGLEILDNDKNLLSTSYGIPTYLFLYIIDELERKSGLEICRILENSSFNVFTVSNFAKGMACLEKSS